MKKPRIPNTKTSSLYNKLFNNEFHPYISVFSAGVYLKFTKPPYGDQLRLRKLGCSNVSLNGVTFLIPEKEFENFKPPILFGDDDFTYELFPAHHSYVSRVVVFEYRVSKEFKNAKFEYQGNTYEVF